MWQNIKTWLATLSSFLPLQRSVLLFGIHSEQYNSVLNYTILLAKSFIWKAKFSSKDLSLIEFQKYLYKKLSTIKNAFILMGKEDHFQRWINVYDYLSGLPGCTEATLPCPTAPVQQLEEWTRPCTKLTTFPSTTRATNLIIIKKVCSISPTSKEPSDSIMTGAPNSHIMTVHETGLTIADTMVSSDRC